MSFLQDFNIDGSKIFRPKDETLTYLRKILKPKLNFRADNTLSRKYQSTINNKTDTIVRYLVYTTFQ